MSRSVVSTTGTRERLLALRSPVVRASVVVVASLLLAKKMAVFSGLTPTTVLAIVPVTLLVFWFCQSPRWPIAAFLFTTLLGMYRGGGIGLGPINARLPDLPYLFMVGWAVLIRAREGRVQNRPIGQPYLALFLGVLGLSLFPVLVDKPSISVDGLVGWLRFVETLSVIWLVPYLLRSAEDRLWLIRIVMLSIVVELLYALVIYSRSGVSVRLVGSNGPNAEGLLAAILVILALYSPVPRRAGARLFCLLLGILGLGLARSIGSVVAVGLVLGIYGLRAAAARWDLRKDALVRPLRLLLLLVVVLTVVATLRPNDLPGAQGFNFSSAAYRVVVGYAGLQIWADHPILGVGWQQSSRPEYISDPKLIDQLRERFPDANPSFLPSIAGASVHNAYVQVLAESGLIGALVLILALIAARRRITALLADLTGTDWVVAMSAALVVLVVLIWWNDNPFYGSQPETVLAATFLGLLASYGKGRAAEAPPRDADGADAGATGRSGRGVVAVPSHA